MIPKIIHYCWFGGNKMPPLAVKCIKSWKKNCKGYEIMEWNEKNFSIADAPLYVRQAYEAKKWAFVTDYVRLYAMVNYGGIYMDTDVEVIKPLDKLLDNKAFSGFENETSIPTGIMASEKNFPLFKELLAYYDDASFYNDDGTINYTTNVEVITNICKKYGFEQNNKFQIIEGFALYPKDVFCPKDFKTGKLRKTKNTVSIHWFSASWHDAEFKKREKERNRIKQKKRIKAKIKWIKRIPNRLVRMIVGENGYEKIKKFFGVE